MVDLRYRNRSGDTTTRRADLTCGHGVAARGLNELNGSHTIQNLETYTQYLVSLQVFNPEGPGPNTTVLVMTDEGELPPPDQWRTQLGPPRQPNR
ncbi:hypothetical protein BDFB_001616 [Asbolus verrucosus]|uniref:Fibronectin type-III domain-containing protein n=1 Tax=Asbolus verrucosus TaxID=1661398 RepID=A0A482VSU9_ASBVE|nr:hypothetical protein BDFB_001616 [Asbolus verrucosus]